MAGKFQIRTTQSFTFWGKLGIGLLLGGPIVSAIGYNWLMVELLKPYGSSVFGPAALMLISGLAFLASFPLIIIGRDQLHVAQAVQETKGENGLWS